MIHYKTCFNLLCLQLSISLSLPSITSAAPALQENDLIAICGDSITEQRKYSVNMAAYFLMCQPESGLRSMQLGQGGENASIFSKRLISEVLPFQPDVVTTCYGMNDGGYQALNDDRALRFRESTQKYIDELRAAGVRRIVLGGPGAVDPQTFSRSGRPTTAEIYNQTLSSLSDIAREIAAHNNLIFVDIHTPMLEVIHQAEAKYGPEYYVAGSDGIHASDNGQFIMSYAFLKALGCDGQIGTITYDAETDTATATSGHTILSAQLGAIDLESTRYPFCFAGDPSSPNSSIGMLEFIPFNQELNRYMLVVKHAPAQQMKVTWGEDSKVFSAAELAQGINLADEFLNSPFYPAFRKVVTALHAQQGYESRTIRPHLKMLLDWEQGFPEAFNEKPELFAWQKTKIIERAAERVEATAQKVVPVQHRIVIESVE
ncbi:SGNH/GDSL hydrolase family protein [Coraliomargarita algicola]|uniref:SGNH/GDSL hydrolase family protein n=1 Tax=Coraliomargarita algicola TaxID=3092156 RepID=A0ABZ0RLB6_9BACT|nr:SGNH/GDSL hydrolase family protein [Coraliomargarita sp. J2-16]WPJ95800.1 SGNH/GDSL hydrolase family protein [Coraliomargarita sp. J2-16]